MVVYSLICLIGAYFLFVFVRGYRDAIGSMWQRAIAAAKGSATVLWARFTVIVTAGVTALAQVADFLNAPSVASAIQTYLSPKVVAVIFVATAIITEFARRRTLPRD